MATKKLYRGTIAIIAWLVLVTIAMFLPSCSSSNTEENKEPESTTKTVELKVVDMLEAYGEYAYGPVNVTYLLLEDGSVEIMHGKGALRHFPYTKEEAKTIMAFRRGEEVTLKIEVPTK